MEIYFLAAQSKLEMLVGEIIKRIDPKHFDEIVPYVSLEYYKFREKLLTIFKPPNLKYTRMQQLARLRQERDESIEDYMICALRLVLQAHQDFQPKEQEELLISHLSRGWLMSNWRST